MKYLIILIALMVSGCTNTDKISNDTERGAVYLVCLQKTKGVSMELCTCVENRMASHFGTNFSAVTNPKVPIYFEISFNTCFLNMYGDLAESLNLLRPLE